MGEAEPEGTGIQVTPRRARTHHHAPAMRQHHSPLPHTARGLTAGSDLDKCFSAKEDLTFHTSSPLFVFFPPFNLCWEPVLSPLKYRCFHANSPEVGSSGALEEAAVRAQPALLPAPASRPTASSHPFPHKPWGTAVLSVGANLNIERCCWHPLSSQCPSNARAGHTAVGTPVCGQQRGRSVCLKGWTAVGFCNPFSFINNIHNFHALPGILQRA